jgi:hypothetical protein
MTPAIQAPVGLTGTHPAADRAELRTLRLRGSRTWVCRRCRSPIRAVSAYYLPDACPACGAATWPGGRCACSATRRPGSRGRAFCHACGCGVWARVGGDLP